MPILNVDNAISELKQNLPLPEMLKRLISSLPSNRVVSEVVIDGRRVAVSHPNTWARTITGTIEEVQIRTVDKALWAESGFDFALSNLDRVRQSLARAAEMLVDLRPPQAERFVSKCLDGLEKFHDSLQATEQALGIELIKMTIDGVALQRLIDDFSQLLEQIYFLSEREDFAAIAEKIDFELLPNLYTWRRSLEVLRDRMPYAGG